MEREFFVIGLSPVDRAVNQLIKACDLGFDGAFVDTALNVQITCADDTPQAKLDQHADALRQAFEHIGWQQVKVIEVAEWALLGSEAENAT